jgi:hypothetical protein
LNKKLSLVALLTYVDHVELIFIVIYKQEKKIREAGSKQEKKIREAGRVNQTIKC